jgi:UrcA family protein
MKRNINRLAMAAALGVALGAGSVWVQAQDPMEETTITGQASRLNMPVVTRQGVETRRVTVSYADLRLESQAGINALYHRIETAAATVCGEPAYKQGRLAGAHQDWRHCLDKAVDGAVGEVNNVALSRYHLAQTGRRVGPDEQVAGR